jgi:hypothetical protein
VINAAAGSLQRLLWSINTENRKYLIFSRQILVLIPLAANHISLNQLCRLEFLTLRALLAFKRISDLPDWGQHFQIKKILKDSFIPQTLKRLTIIVVVWGAGSTGSDWGDIYDSMVWKDLELVLSSASTLQQVLIYFRFKHCSAIPGWFWVCKILCHFWKNGEFSGSNRIQISFEFGSGV